MKKLIAILLVAACMLVMASCSVGGGTAGDPQTPATNTETQNILDALAEQVKKSAPTKSEVSTLVGNADINLETSEITVMGEVSGKDAALYICEQETLNDLGAANISKTLQTERVEYVEGLGVRTNGGAWEDMPTIVRKIQPYRMNLDASLIQGFTVNADKTSYAFAIPAKNVAAVLTGLDVSTVTSDVSVVIETDGSAVTRIALSYEMKSIALDATTKIDNCKVSIDAIYSYDLQSITLIDKK